MTKYAVFIRDEKGEKFAKQYIFANSHHEARSIYAALHPSFDFAHIETQKA